MILRVYWKPLDRNNVTMQVYVGSDGDSADELLHAGNLQMPAMLFYELTQGQLHPEFFDSRGMGGPPQQ